MCSLGGWISENANSSEVITCSKEASVLVGANVVDVSAISSRREDSIDVPTKLALDGMPQSWIRKRVLTISHLLAFFNVVVDLGIGLIDSSQEL